MTIASDVLPDDAGTLKAMLIAERAQNDRLRQIIKELQRHRFGRRAETLPQDQMRPMRPSGQPGLPSVA
jgi:transposase